MTTRVGECLIFTPAECFHLTVETELGRVPMSVRRFAYALAFPDDPVTEREDVILMCNHRGDFTGARCCVEPTHLLKVPFTETRTIRK